MRRATTTLALAFIGALFGIGSLGSAKEAGAVPIANESFLYSPGPLPPNNGGSGFGVPWAGDPGVSVQPPGLMHPLALGSSGLMIGGGFNSNRSLSAAISQNIFWASFLIQANPGNDQVWLGFDIAATPLPMITFGRRLDSYFIQNGSNPPATLPGASPPGVTDLLIARITRGGAATTVDLWVNKRPIGPPDLSQVFGPVPPPSVVNTQVQPGLYADEIHIGTAPGDVALAGVPPSLDPADIDWSTIPGGAVRFHLRFRNNDPGNTSDPISGDMQSQNFGVFQPDFGPIGQFNVPAIPPNSFFDVFFDVPLSQLPTPPEKLTPNSLMAGGTALASAKSQALLAACPPDDHWDGNVDIHWSGPAGGGTVTKHIASMQVCPGGGHSNIHTLVFCGAPSTWTITGLCPGWTATLVNESPPLVPDGPAPNPVPAGWTGFIQVSAGAVVPPGATCPIKVTFDCGGVPGVIDLNPVACECQPVLPPGTPLSGAGFTVDIRERPDSPGQPESIFGPFALPVAVQRGFVVLLEDPAGPSNDPHNWSDVVDLQSHQAAQQAYLVSDPSEQGITDADLAPLGLSIAQVMNGNTVYVQEQTPTIYDATDPTTGIVGHYRIVSDVVVTTLDPADVDWTTIPGGAVRFHLRFRNLDPENPTEPISGDMQSQNFGVFQPDFGPIGQFNVPAIPPNSFFDVFFDVPLNQLPPPPEKLTPGSMVAGRPTETALAAGKENVTLAACPPDDHWDGNVDIHWSGPAGGGTVTKHIASMQVCPGGGHSDIHTLVFCGSPSSWTITGVCPGWSATLVNESPPLVPDGPAPNPVPAGWTGFIRVSASAVVPPGATCPIKVTFDCGGVPGVIDLNPVACQCQPVLPPGTPLGGRNFVINMVEPVESPAGGEPVFGPFDLPSLVQPGFVVLLEQAGVPQNDPSNWSDVVDFKTHQAAQQAFLVSDPSEQGITDADLAPLGLSIAQVLNGNTVFVLEQSPVTLWQGVNPTTGLTGSYNIISDNPGNLDVENTGAVAFGIRSATPNPSRGSLRLEYGLSRAASVRVEVYDVAGKLVRTLRDGASKAGVGSVTWDGLNRSGERVAAGTYFIMLRSEGQSAVHRVVMLH